MRRNKARFWPALEASLWETVVIVLLTLLVEIALSRFAGMRMITPPALFVVIAVIAVGCLVRRLYEV